METVVQLASLLVRETPERVGPSHLRLEAFGEARTQAPQEATFTSKVATLKVLPLGTLLSIPQMLAKKE